jgi:hypothetical protein
MPSDDVHVVAAQANGAQSWRSIGPLGGATPAMGGVLGGGFRDTSRVSVASSQAETLIGYSWEGVHSSQQVGGWALCVWALCVWGVGALCGHCVCRAAQCTGRALALINALLLLRCAQGYLSRLPHGATTPSSPPIKLTNLSPEAASHAFAEVEIVHWASDDGLQVEGMLLKPPTATVTAMAAAKPNGSESERCARARSLGCSG